MTPVPLVVSFGALDALLFAQAAYFVTEYTARDAKQKDDDAPPGGDA